MTAGGPRAATISVRGISRERHGPSWRTHGGKADVILSLFALRRQTRTIDPVWLVARPSGTLVKISEAIAAVGATGTVTCTPSR